MKYKNLLPSNLIGTRWEQFAATLESFISELKINHFSKLKNKFNPEEALPSDLDNLRDLVERKGYKLIEGDGYSSSLEYHKRRAICLPIEIKWNLSETGYAYLFKSFWLLCKAYTLVVEEINLISQLFPYTSIISNIVINQNELLLDQESDLVYYYIEFENVEIPVPNPPIQTGLPILYLDTEEFPNLDITATDQITNHFLLSFSFYVVEEKDVWLSYNTAKALFETVQQMHRLKEIPHFRPEITVNINTNGTVWKKQFISYDKDSTKISYLETKYFTDNFTNATVIQFGSQPYANLENLTNISGVNKLISQSTIINDFNIIESNPYSLKLEHIITEFKKFLNENTTVFTFSEIAILNSSNQVIFYIKHPEINFYEFMYSNLKLEIRYEE